MQKDIHSYGEFITSYEIDNKIQLLDRLTSQMLLIVENKDVILDRICDQQTGNILMVEEDK